MTAGSEWVVYASPVDEDDISPVPMYRGTSFFNMIRAAWEAHRMSDSVTIFFDREN